MWAKKCAADAADNHNPDSEEADWRSLFREHFAPIIQYHKIAARVILDEIMPLGVVPDRDLLSALAYQVQTIKNDLFQCSNWENECRETLLSHKTDRLGSIKYPSPVLYNFAHFFKI